MKKLYIVILIALQALHGCSGVIYALLLKNIVDGATAKDMNRFKANAIYIVILVLIQLLLRALIRHFNEKARISIENIFRERLFAYILDRDYGKVSAIHSGEWLNRLTSDTEVVSGGYVEILPGLVGMLVKLTSALLMLVIIDSRFALILVPGGIALILLTFFFRKVIKMLHKRVQETGGKMRIYMQERIESLMMISQMDMRDKTLEGARGYMKDYQKVRLSKNTFANVCNIGYGLCMNGMYLFGVIYCGYGILEGLITYGTLTAITQLISQIQMPVANITGYLPRFYAMVASGERLMEIERFEPDHEEVVLSDEQIKNFYDDEFKSISLKNISFKYYPAAEKIEDISKENMPFALKNFSMTVNKGEYVAFTGHSGCGKSTALKLMMGIYKVDGGSIKLNLESGKSTDLNAKYKRLFAYVPQGNHLMSGSIKDVICSMGKYDEDKLNMAIKVSCADEFINELDGGALSELGEKGAGLSEGQMQRIAIARAVYADHPIIIFDEATSSLDEETEGRLLKNLKELTSKTVIIITHRKAAISICDRVLEFDEDGVKERKII